MDFEEEAREAERRAKEDEMIDSASNSYKSNKSKKKRKTIKNLPPRSVSDEGVPSSSEESSRDCASIDNVKEDEGTSMSEQHSSSTEEGAWDCKDPRRIYFSDAILPSTYLISQERRYTRTQERQYLRWIQEARKQGIIEKVSLRDLKAISQPVIVKKKEGGFRITHDFTLVNANRQRTAKFPAEAKVQNIIRWARTKGCVAKIDLTKAFHDIEIEPNQRQYYGISQGRGIYKKYYRYKKMPMGAAGAPKCFHTWMKLVLSGLSKKDRPEVQHYQDDIIITAKDEETLRKRFERVRELVSKFSVVNESKSIFGRIVPILGLEFDNHQKVIRLPQDKKDSLSELFQKQKWESLFGLLNYCDLFLNVGAKSYLCRIMRQRRKMRQPSLDEVAWCDKLIKRLHNEAIPYIPLRESKDQVQIFVDSCPTGIGLLIKQAGIDTFCSSMRGSGKGTSTAHMEARGAWEIIKKTFSQFKELIRSKEVTLKLDNAAMSCSARKMLDQENEEGSDIDNYTIKIIRLLKSVTSRIIIEQVLSEHQEADEPSRRFETARQPEEESTGRLVTNGPLFGDPTETVSHVNQLFT